MTKKQEQEHPRDEAPDDFDWNNPKAPPGKMAVRDVTYHQVVGQHFGASRIVLYAAKLTGQALDIGDSQTVTVGDGFQYIWQDPHWVGSFTWGRTYFIDVPVDPNQQPLPSAGNIGLRLSETEWPPWRDRTDHPGHDIHGPKEPKPEKEHATK